MSYSPSINLILHGCAFSIFGYALYWQEVHMKPIPQRLPQGHYAGKWKYLTNWDLVIQFVFFTICLICDLSKYWGLSKCKTLKKFRDSIFHGLAFPTALYVTITFWAIYAIDRELILPRALDPYFPNWLNHTVHTLITPFILIESVLNYHKIPKDRVGLTLLYILVIGYTLWTFYIALVIKFWIYPVMEVMDWPSRILFMSTGTMFFTILYFIGTKLHKKLHKK